MSAPRTVAGAVLLGLAEGAAAFLVLALIAWLAVLLLHVLLAPSQLAVNEHCPAYAYAVMAPTGPGCATPGHFGFRARGR